MNYEDTLRQVFGSDFKNQVSTNTIIMQITDKHTQFSHKEIHDAIECNLPNSTSIGFKEYVWVIQFLECHDAYYL